MLEFNTLSSTIIVANQMYFTLQNLTDTDLYSRLGKARGSVGLNTLHSNSVCHNDEYFCELAKQNRFEQMIRTISIRFDSDAIVYVLASYRYSNFS